ncbi:MAG: DUF1852 domain-containing protein [Agrobacterium vaccinii]
MDSTFTFSIRSIPFDEDYSPSENTRATTNFANLARGENCRENLRNALRMIDNRFNAMAHWDNPLRDRYAVEIEIVSVEVSIGPSGEPETFPIIEVLKTDIVDQATNERIEGVVGNNFSSYVRDYDFSVLLPEHNKDKAAFSTPNDFGDLHGKLFQAFLNSEAYKEHFSKPPVICLSASSTKIYHRTDNQHPILGIEYRQNEFSPTDRYFEKMGLLARYFMPPNSVAPFAFYFIGDLLTDYTNLELISTISTMETFQKIYRPEIYNANSVAGTCYRPNLKHSDYSLTQVVYDREERSRLAVEQGRFAEQHFIKPFKTILDAWSANYVVR